VNENWTKILDVCVGQAEEQRSIIGTNVRNAPCGVFEKIDQQIHTRLHCPSEVVRWLGADLTTNPSHPKQDMESEALVRKGVLGVGAVVGELVPDALAQGVA
jgi:hypothetical protein